MKKFTTDMFDSENELLKAKSDYYEKVAAVLAARLSDMAEIYIDPEGHYIWLDSGEVVGND